MSSIFWRSLSKMSRDNRLIVVYMLAVLMINSAICRTSMYSNTWVAQVEGGQEEAQKIAREKDLILLGQVSKSLSISSSLMPRSRVLFVRV